MPAVTLASPESAGMSKAALDRVEAHLKARYIEAGRFPGTQLESIAAASSFTPPCRGLPTSSARPR